MNTLLFRVGAILMHVFLNIVIVSYVTRYDVTGSWIAMTGFVLLLFIMLGLLVMHIMSFLNFLKHKAK